MTVPSIVKKFVSVFALVAAIGFGAPALAQEGGIATLAAQAGKVSVSSNGEFAGVPTGQVLRRGDRLMLLEDASATLRLGSGCSVNFDKPGVYEIPEKCGRPLAAGTDWAGAAKVAGGVAVVAAILAAQDDSLAPVSR
ncbi:hypothetical protein [Pseudoxanthomonas koreensis]|uniref:hypothetical protein n=1 Tax=Pseudoxanthomonas koreensis TaxID=266061 RepID=UPI00139191EB|nr:hypothetical protein [Pseudoxanthomonas koreensis]KAF1695293.1 hypothetical protein CSC64_03330 [Pseudoxanthomonas koreensis]